MIAGCNRSTDSLCRPRPRRVRCKSCHAMYDVNLMEAYRPCDRPYALVPLLAACASVMFVSLLGACVSFCVPACRVLASFLCPCLARVCLFVPLLAACASVTLVSLLGACASATLVSLIGACASVTLKHHTQEVQSEGVFR